MAGTRKQTLTVGPPAPLRCAIYTRTSVVDHDDPAFSSNLGQREACAAFIASQRGEHWVEIDYIYDDPGWSGQDVERPALKLLLADIKRGQVQVVVVQRLDRLSRTVADLTRLTSFFDEHGVALVSVSQQIDSSTSLGRLALNTLMSFAQFEREIIGERTRDKIGASRHKGLWHSAPPFGYDVRDHRLMINAAEAATVRYIFQGFLDHGQTSTLAMELNAQGVTTKAWKTSSGKVRGGLPIDKTYLYKLLHNRMFLGEVRCAGVWHPGQHEAIITSELWTEVHALISYRTRAMPTTRSERFEFMLRGRVFGVDGRAYTPWRSTRRKCRVYCYYIPQKEIAVGAGTSGLPRYSAFKLENLVMECLRETLRDPSRLIKGLPEEFKIQPDYNEANVVNALSGLDVVWHNLWPGLQKVITLQFVQKVIIGPDDFVLNIDIDGVMRWTRDLHHQLQGESSGGNEQSRNG